MYLFPAAYASVQNIITSVMLDGSVRFAYRFVVLFSILELASLPLFPPFRICLISDFPLTFLQRRTTKSGNHATWRVVHVKIIWYARINVRISEENTYITTCKEWMLLLQLQGCYNNIISCLNFYSSCIKKMVNPDGKK